MFNITHSLSVRYADIDAQGHVNHATYFSYMEQARMEYFIATGLWLPAQGFMGVGSIVAEAACTYKKPILLGQTVLVGVRVTRIGTKSFQMEYELSVEGEVVAIGRTAQVAYDYVTQQSIPVPEAWRKAVEKIEGGL